MAAPGGAPLRAAYRLAVNAMLATVTGVDRARFRRDPVADEWLAQRLTVTAKTFLRPATARRFVRSSRRTFTGRVVLADDSPRPMPSPDAGTTVLSLPFRSGVAAGRNAAVDAVCTEYVMVSDDDVVMTAGTDLGRAVAFLDEHPEVDAVCATLIEVPRWRTWQYGGEGDLFPGHLPPLRSHGELVGGLPVVLKGPQVYVARTESLRRVRYDEHLRMVDHRDFFSTACGRLVFVSDPKLVAFHARTPFDRAYVAHRDDIGADTAYLSRKWFSDA